MRITFEFDNHYQEGQHKERPIIENSCGCLGKDGRPKRLYETRELAEENAAYRGRLTGVHLNVYECPCGCGYHITSNQNQW